MQIEQAQVENRRAYVGGGPGALVSGVVWLAAAWAGLSHDIKTTYAILFVGGMLIFPVSKLIEGFLFKRRQPSAENTLGRAALESTIAMIGGLFTAWLLIDVKPQWVLPVAAIAVGLHYFAFRTTYGDVLYWLLGGLIAILGFAEIYHLLPIQGGLALAVALVELLFGIVLTMRSLTEFRGDLGSN